MKVYLVIHWSGRESFEIVGTYSDWAKAEAAMMADAEPGNCEVYELEVQP